MCNAEQYERRYRWCVAFCLEPKFHLTHVSTEYLNIDASNVLVFIDHHSSRLRHHPCPDTAAQPDIGAITQSHHDIVPKRPAFTQKKHQTVPEDYHTHEIHTGLPWHLLDSVIELKSKRDSDGPFQVGAYDGLLNQARPDKPGVYCLSLSPRQYRILWSDPSGLYSSEDFKWDSLLPFISYVLSLYTPPDSHIKLDDTITLDPNRDVQLSPRWVVRFQGETYSACRVEFVGSPWTRQSWIAISGDAERPRIIKDQYQTRGRRYDEGILFDILQKDISNSPAPGCVHVERHGEVAGIQTPIAAKQRQRKRMVMTTYGRPLYDCPSVFEFLKVMYDTLEGTSCRFPLPFSVASYPWLAHRWVLETKGVLHRDLSINNILLPLKPVANANIDSRPKFVDEILDIKSASLLVCQFSCRLSIPS